MMEDREWRGCIHLQGALCGVAQRRRAAEQRWAAANRPARCGCCRSAAIASCHLLLPPPVHPQCLSRQAGGLGTRLAAQHCLGGSAACAQQLPMLLACCPAQQLPMLLACCPAQQLPMLLACCPHAPLPCPPLLPRPALRSAGQRGGAAVHRGQAQNAVGARGAGASPSAPCPTPACCKGGTACSALAGEEQAATGDSTPSACPPACVPTRPHAPPPDRGTAGAAGRAGAPRGAGGQDRGGALLGAQALKADGRVDSKRAAADARLGQRTQATALAAARPAAGVPCTMHMLFRTHACLDRCMLICIDRL